jgi:retron-type reverse transcriptase
VLKLLTHLLQGQYDHLFADNLYSFRQGTGVRDAIRRLTGTPDIRRMWSYKVDISNYFNSVPVDRVRTLLGNTLADEPETARFLESLLMNPLVEDNGAWVPEEKGIMAGTPISTFLANLYLAHMDHYFADAGVLYARYSDDIIVFAPAEEVLVQYIAKIRGFLSEAGLSVNSGKEERSAPGEMWTYLGVCFRDGVVDVAPVSVEKLKAKMRRKARALVRWQARKELDGV